MAGDSAVRSLLEKMTECASAAYLRMLERLVMVHNYLYGSSFRTDALSQWVAIHEL
jgi:hypothetical protein